MVENGYESKHAEIVWVRPLNNGDFQLPWAARIIERNGSKFKVSDEEGNIVFVDNTAIIKELHPSDIKPVNDMINLYDLSEHSLLRNIHLRYNENIIYTYVGGILVAVNPYKNLNIYSEDFVCKYQGKRLFEQDPHIFAIAAQALANLKRQLHNQCIVISGETGSGKTESTKFLLNFLAASSSKSSIGNKIVQANPILEEFGNAKTTQNDNSSRFGKYIEIFFRKDGTMSSASMQHYLLEKARIKSQNLGDRNYHIFYSLLAGLPQDLKFKLKLTKPDDYFYLKQGSAFICEGRDEKEEFSRLNKAFSTLNFTDKEISSIFQLLAAVLHIGNFTYISKDDNDEDTQVKHDVHLNSAIQLLFVEEEHFVQALTHKLLLVEGTKVVSNMTIEQAKRNRDAFAMSLYNHLFSFILTTINKSISNHKRSGSPSIGILDIFGFENFTSNSFEQLCINYANEHLQQFFVGHVFKLEQQEYIQQNIQWESLSYEDNENVLGLISLNKMSILSILDEQTKFPKGTDRAILLKCNQLHSHNANYIRPKAEVNLVFGIKHYAGTVSYSVEGFIEKNVNVISLEWREVISESGSQFLKDLFIKELNSGKSRHLTLAGQYKVSLESLMTTLGSGTPFFIRCIKPNLTKESNVFNRELVCQQLRYAGMMETAKIRQTGYPIRYSYKQFVSRYRVIVPGCPIINKIIDVKETAKTICERYLNKEEYQFGKTKIFLKIPDEKLECIRDQIFSKSAVILQKHFKGALARVRFLRIRNAAVVIQKYWRGYKPRSNFRVIQRGYHRLKAVLRSRQLKHDYSKMRSSIISLQARCRGFLARKKVLNLKTMKKPKIPPKPIPKPRKNSLPKMWIDDFITNVFDNAIEDNNDPSELGKGLTKANNHNNDSVKEILEKPGILSFNKFAAANFMGNVNYKFTNKVLDQPLLELVLPGDVMAANVIWVTILRFMGDLEESTIFKDTTPKTRKTIMSQLQGTVSRSFLNSQDYSKILDAFKAEENKLVHDNFFSGRKLLKNLSLLHRNKLEREVKRAQLELEDLKKSYEDWAVGSLSTLIEKLYFIIGHGILRPTLRDEIYCQICKQLTDNPDSTSNMYGWILMALCTSSFPPSPKLSPTLLHFLAKGGNMLGCLTRLQRTLENGARSQPPTAFELDALKNQEKMTVKIFLLDDSTVFLDVDSATTAKELCQGVRSKINLEDSFGFSIFVSMFGQTISLESEKWFLMDAISQCEMRADEGGLPEIKAPWSVVFRREIFPPWQISVTDSVSINLTYIQIIKGIAIGDYKCSQQCELELLVAQHYYISCGKRLLPEILDSFLKEVVPDLLLKRKHINWAKAVSDSFNKSYFIKRKIPEEEVRIDVVNFAKKKWPLLFSRYYEVTQIAGYYLGSSDILLAINSDGIMLVKNSMEIIMKITYIEIESFEFIAGTSNNKDKINIATIHQHQFVFTSEYAAIISTSINSVLDGLMLKSKYAVAIGDYSPPDESFLKLHTGDLIVLSNHESNGKWMRGNHADSGHIGEFPTKLVKILPCVEKPPVNILVSYAEAIKAEKSEIKPTLLIKKHTLETYASKYFRSDRFPAKGRKQELWQFSANKIFSPLHHGLSNLSHLITPMCTAIYHYMGDQVQHGQPHYTRAIFEPPLRFEVLCDELYCQILKQMTENTNESSLNKGWELLLLTTCLYPPSSILINEVELWLNSRPCEMSGECLQRIKMAKFHGNSRKLPHHWLEVAAVQSRISILHPVTFPNNMEHVFEVNSFTKVKDIVEAVSNWLGLTTSEGFSLIVVYEDVATALHANEFLFDAILDACHFRITADGNFETPKYEYDLMFVKKLWMNTYAGVDQTADLVCHYYQELPKYLAGSHNCTVNDAMYLGALIFIADLDEGSLDVQKEILKKLPNLIPEQLLQGLNPQEWLNGLIRSYEQNKILKSDEAKIMFLKETQKWPNFGSAFFIVYQSSSFQDEQKTLVVNRNGVCLVYSSTKEIIVFLPYSEILNCDVTNLSISLKTTKQSLTWYSKASMKIADLVNSYIEAYDTKYLLH